MKKIIILSSVFFGILIIGCDKNSDNVNRKVTTLTGSNLAGAKATFITGSMKSTAKSGSEDYNNIKLYKVNVDNQIQPVIFTDEKGNSVNVIVDYLFNLSVKYAVMQVYYEDNQWSKFVYIIRKSDGNLFATPETIENNGTSWNDPLYFFSEYILYRYPNFLYYIKSDAEGNVYFNGTGTGMLSKIHEKNGNTTITPMNAFIWKDFTFNIAGDVFGKVYDEGLNEFFDTWITADGQQIRFDKFNVIHQAETKFALSCAPNSFFSIVHIYDTTTANHPIFEKSVLAECTVQDGEIVQEYVHEFTKGLDLGSYPVATTKEGLGIAFLQIPNLDEICVIKDKTIDGISYVPLSENSHFYGVGASYREWNLSSYRYVYKNTNYDYYKINPNRFSRFDPQTGTDMPDYYTLPDGYIFKHFWVTYDDILTILAEIKGHNEESVWFEVDADGNENIYDRYNGEKIILRSAF